jgi:Bacterial Ig domain
MKKLLILAALLSYAGGLRAQTTYYIDPASGSNSNNGTSTSTPWKSHPYMSTSAACTGSGSLPAYTHHAGDKFVWKGGTTVPAACLPLTITKSGTSGAIDYYGVCLSTDSASPCSGGTSWPSSGWTRPLFDAAYANKNYMISASGITYVTIDNLELAHQGITFSSTYTTDGCGIFFSNVNYSGNAGTTVENVYLHDWVGLNDMNGKLGTICEGGIEAAQRVLYSEIEDSSGCGYNGTTQVFQVLGGGVAYGGEVAYNKIHDSWNGATTILGAGVHDNEFYGMEQNTLAGLVDQPSGLHTQVIEDNESCSTLTGSYMAVYNNYIHDNHAGVNIFVRYWSDVYNNVMFNNQGNQQIRLCVPPNGDQPSDVGHVFNNVFDLNVGTYSTAIGPTTYGTHTTADGTIYIQNNITISTTGSDTVGGITATTSHNSNNYSMGNTEASTYGFTAANKYAPTSSDSNVTGKGLNLTGMCSGGMAALCSDPEGAPWYAGTYQPRPTGSTAWTLGAYVWPVGGGGGGGGGGGTPPTVTITTPTNGATVAGSIAFDTTCTPTGGTVASINESVDGTTFGGAGVSSPYTQTWDTTKMSNQPHTLGAGCTDSNSLTGTATPAAVTVSNSIPGCFISDFNWDNSQSFGTQTGVFTVTFTATPFASPNDLVVGISANPATAYGDMAAIVRFNPSGQIDVFNGSLGTYSALTSVSYTAGTAYAFTVTINISAHTYNVQLTSPTNTTLATNYAFRGTQSGVTSLSYINAHSDLDSLHNVEVCNASLGSGTLQFTPGALSFGNVADGVTATNGVVTTASGGSATFTSVGISGDSAFTITGNTCTGTVSNCTVTVQFLGYGVGLKTATLTFTDSTGESPQSIAVSAVSVPLPGVVVPIPTMVF